jgi:hypothetical protein
MTGAACWTGAESIYAIYVFIIPNWEMAGPPEVARNSRYEDIGYSRIRCSQWLRAEPFYSIYVFIIPNWEVAGPPEVARNSRYEDIGYSRIRCSPQ